jgi:hypothetical protein
MVAPGCLVRRFEMKSRSRIGVRNVRSITIAILTLAVGASFVIGGGVPTRAHSDTPQSLGNFDAASSAAVIVDGPNADAHLGGSGSATDFTPLVRSRALAVGDFNGDGIADIAVAAPDEAVTVPQPSGPPQVRNNAGVVYILFGKSHFTGVIDTSTTTPDIVIFGANAGDRLGFSMAAGDVNGDGVDDLLIGAPGVSFNNTNRTNTGAVFGILGSKARASGTTIDLGSANAADLVIFGIFSGDEFGSAVAVGDVGGQATQTPADRSAADIVVGAPGFGDLDGSRPGTGGAFAVFGGSTLNRVAGQTTKIDLGGATTPAGVILVGSNAGDALGSSVAVGDVNGTAPGDIIAGAPHASRPGSATVVSAANTGAAYVVFGSTLGASVTLPEVLETGSGQQNVAIYGANSNDRAGFSVAAGDVNADGNADIIIGAPDASGPPSSPRVHTGDVFVVAGGAGLVVPAGQPPVRVDLLLALTQAPSPNNLVAFLAYGSAAEDHLGSTVAAGTYNILTFNTATPEVIMGAPGYNNQEGAVSVVFGGASLVAAPLRDLAFGNDDIRITTGGSTNNLNSVMLRETLTTSNAMKPQLLDLTMTVNGNGATHTETTTSDFAAGTLTHVVAGSVGDGDLELASTFTNGNRVSPAITAFNGVSPIISSMISWDATTPAGTAVTVETSLDGGHSFQTAVNGGPIPSVKLGDNLGWAIAAGDVNGDNAGDLVIAAPFANVQIGQNPIRVGAGAVYALTGTSPVPPPPPPPKRHPPTVTLSAPVGGETLLVGHNFDIKWTAADPDGADKIKSFDLALSTDGGVTFPSIVATALPGTATDFNWTAPNSLVGLQTCRIKVTVTDDIGNGASDSSKGNFSVTDHGVGIALTSPAGGEKLTFGQSFTISWSVPASDQSLVKGFDLFLSSDGGTTFPLRLVTGPDPAQPGIGGSTFSFNWTVSPICTASAKISVIATSLTNMRTSATTINTFSIQDLGPTVDTTAMSVLEDVNRLFLTIGQPASGNAVNFADGVIVEISGDSTGIQFFGFSRPPKLKGGGARLMTKGTINGQILTKFFPTNDTRVIRITNPTCGVTVLHVTRHKDRLDPVSGTG